MQRIKQYSARKTYPQLLFHPFCLVIEFPAIEGDDVVVEGIRWTRHSCVLNNSREVFPSQKADDAIEVAFCDPMHSPQTVQDMSKW
jgi:hypothetical protein